MYHWQLPIPSLACLFYLTKDSLGADLYVTVHTPCVLWFCPVTIQSSNLICHLYLSGVFHTTDSLQTNNGPQSPKHSCHFLTTFMHAILSACRAISEKVSTEGDFSWLPTLGEDTVWYSDWQLTATKRTDEMVAQFFDAKKKAQKLTYQHVIITFSIQ